MSEHTGISWTDATWNPVTGCSKVSPGCVSCYAEKLSLRFRRSAKPWTAQNAAENVKLHPDRLTQPLRWRTPRRVFVNSMSDLFHERVPDGFIDRVFAVMALARQHTFQILTKRPERMREYFDIFTGLHAPDYDRRWDDARRWLRSVLLAQGERASMGRPEYVGVAMAHQSWPLPNVWLGVSCEDQQRADERIPLLLQTPAAVRFISAEPLLGPLNIAAGLFTQPPSCSGIADDGESPEAGGLWNGPAPLGERGLSWVIVGGESGPNRREMDLAWAANIKRQCDAAGVAYFFKQRSAFKPGVTDGVPADLLVQDFPQSAGGAA